jgi:hypothetical protein
MKIELDAHDTTFLSVLTICITVAYVTYMIVKWG